MAVLAGKPPKKIDQKSTSGALALSLSLSLSLYRVIFSGDFGHNKMFDTVKAKLSRTARQH